MVWLNSDISRALLAVFLPRSTNYVGKNVHEPLAIARTYHCTGSYWWLGASFWLQFLVRPMVAPSVQIIDDYLNYPQISGRG